jgi:hypothetical protein
MNTCMTAESYLTVQVQFNAGVIKTFLAPQEIRMADFVAAVKAYGGKFRSMRFQGDTDAPAAEALVREGNAIKLEAKSGQG